MIRVNHVRMAIGHDHRFEVFDGTVIEVADEEGATSVHVKAGQIFQDTVRLEIWAFRCPASIRVGTDELSGVSLSTWIMMTAGLRWISATVVTQIPMGTTVVIDAN